MNLACPIVIGLLMTVLSIPAMRALARLWKLGRPNFKGNVIPAGFGFMLVISAVPAYIWMLATSGGKSVAVFLFAVIGFGVIGLIDDIYGTREAGGFRGHIGLLKKGKISTGLIKAGVGGIIALCLGFIISDFKPVLGLVNGLTICLAANFLNLLDLRPGRAVSCFWAGLIIVGCSSLGGLTVWKEILMIIMPAVCLTVLDRSALVMMGDAGSNVLGAVLGLSISYGASLPYKLGFLVFVIAVHLYSEKYSISKLIEANRVLRRMDRLLGER